MITKKNYSFIHSFKLIETHSSIVIFVLKKDTNEKEEEKKVLNSNVNRFHLTQSIDTEI